MFVVRDKVVYEHAACVRSEQYENYLDRDSEEGPHHQPRALVGSTIGQTGCADWTRFLVPGVVIKLIGAEGLSDLPVPPVVRQAVRVAAPYVAVGRHFRPGRPGLVLLDGALRVLRERILGGGAAVEPVPQHDGVALAVAGVMVLRLAATHHVVVVFTTARKIFARARAHN